MWHGFESNEYFVERELVVRSVATEKRRSMSATLVIVDSEVTMTFLNSLFDNLRGKIFYSIVLAFKRLKFYYGNFTASKSEV